MIEHRDGELAAADFLVDWELAADIAARLGAPGPRLSPAEAQQEVGGLRKAALDAVGHVHSITRLDAAEGLGADPAETLVVDRAGWAQANARTFRTLLSPAMETAFERKPELKKRGRAQRIGSTATGTELGAILAFLSGKVLGQFDPFADVDAALGKGATTHGEAPHGEAPRSDALRGEAGDGAARGSASGGGKLMLVAPNIVEVQRELDVDPEDFRLWVCLHEQTHRVQFAAAPWLADHLYSKIQQLSTSTMGSADGLPERLNDALKEIFAERRERKKAGGSTKSGDANSNSGSSSGKKKLLQLIQSPEDQELFSHLTAVMSLLEGHANVVMDAVDSSIVPSVRTIRRRFEERGKNRGLLEKWLRKLMQLDVKARQYSDGQKFVGRIVDAVGMEKFNAIWESPEHLPTETELHHPEQWVERMGLTRTP